MNRMRKHFKGMPLVSLILALCLMTGSFTTPVMAHNVDQRMAWMFFDQETIDLITANVNAGKGPVNKGDELGVIIKNLPMPSGATTGVGGYIDFYVPPGTQVTDVGYIWPNADGGYDHIPMKGQSIMSLGSGPVGAKTTTELQGLTLGPNYLGHTSPAVGAGGIHLGTLAGVYGDTGIFYSTDPDTSWQSWANFNTPGNPLDDVIVNNRGESVVPNNLWDAEQLMAYGSKSPAAPIIDYGDGRGNTPWGLGSGVAGPESGYAWQFDKAVWDASAKTPADMRNAAGAKGPWKRIQYAGSQIANDNPGNLSTTLGYAGLDASHIGWDIKAQPLPVTQSLSDTTSPKTVRWSVGMLTAGRPEYVWVKIKIINDPPLLPFIDEKGCFKLRGDVFGGDAGGEQGGKDHLWRYYDPTDAFIDTCSSLLKDFSADIAVPGQEFQFKIYYWNTGRESLTNIRLIDTLSSYFQLVSADPAPLTLSPLTWNIPELKSGETFSAVVTVIAKSSGVMATNTMTATNDQGVTAESTDGVWFGANPIMIQSKTVTPSSVAPGQNVKYTLRIDNDGAGPGGNPVTLTDYLPPGFTYVSLDSVTVNGANALGVTAVSSTNPNQPVFTVKQAISAGQSLLLTFTAKVDVNTPADTYHNSFSSLHTDPVLGKAVSTATGAEAPVIVGGAAAGGTIFHDWSNDGTRNPTAEEGVGPAIAPVVLEIQDGTCTPGLNCRTTTVKPDGTYSFKGLTAGTYTVSILSGVPADYTATTPTSFTVTLTDTQESLNNDIGWLPGGNGSIGDLLFEDTGNDGSYDPGMGDKPIANVTINLYEDTDGNGVIDAEDTLIDTAVTDASGAYSFTDLAEGLDYIVDVDNTDPDFIAYFGGAPSQNTTPDPKPVPNLIGAVTDADFGFFKVTPGSIGDQVFIDENNNGVYDPGIDEPLAFITLNLYQDVDGDGKISTGDRLIKTVETDLDGKYLFDGLGAGNYIVDVDQKDPDLPSGYFTPNDPLTVTPAIAENRRDADFPFVKVLSKHVDKTSANPGDTLTYTITPNYPAARKFTDVTVSDLVPAGTTYLAGSANAGGTESGGTVTWRLGSTTAGIPGGTPGTGLCPGTTTLTADRDTNILSGNATRNYGVTTQIKSRQNDERILLHFPVGTTTLQPGETLLRATLVVTSDDNNNISRPSRVYELNTAWTEGTQNGKTCVTGATWNSPNCSDKWQAAGAFTSSDYTTADSGWLAGSKSGVTDTTDVTAIVQKWLTGSANNGLVIEEINNAGEYKIRSRETANPPQLIIEYMANTPGGCGDIVKTTPAEDTYIREDSASSNYGTDNKLFTRPESTKHKYSLLKFDISEIPPGAVINAAEFGIMASGTRTNHSDRIHRMIRPWTETAAVWGSGWSAGAFGTGDYDAALLGTITPTVKDVYLKADVTSLVTDWYNNTVPNQGIALISEGGDTGDVQYYSREEGNSARWPYLSIDWSIPAGPGIGTTLKAKAGVVTSGTTFPVVLNVSTIGTSVNVTPDTLVITGTNGASAVCTGPVPATHDVDPVADFTWTCKASAGTAPGTLTFSAGASSAGGDVFDPATSNSVIVTPILTFQATVNAVPGVGVVDNTATIQDTSAALSPTSSNMAETALAASISGGVWADLNDNGVRDPGEPGLAGVQVTVTGTDGVPHTVTTHPDGTYTVYDLVPGAYTVTYDYSTAPDGWQPNTVMTQTVTLTDPKQQYTGADFGLEPPGTASIGDEIWIDANKNGIFEAFESPLPGITVELYMDMNNDGLIDAGDILFATAQTDAEGKYLFTGLNDGNYLVKADETGTVTMPDGVTTDTLANLMKPTTLTANPHDVSLADGQAYLTADFAYLWKGSIGDTVWYDNNGNNIQNPGETGIPNVTLILWNDLDRDGEEGATEPVLGFAVTDADGKYLFENVPPGYYVVYVDEATLRDTSGASDTLVPTGLHANIYPVPSLALGQNYLQADLGFMPGAVVGDTVYRDLNSNGVQDPGETGIAGLTITLTGTDIAGNPVTKTAVTDGNGNYQILVPPGDYTVTYNPAGIPAGMTNTTPASIDLYMDAGQEYLDADFGFDNSGTVGDTVFVDADGNGVQDPGDSGIPGVTVYLYSGATLLDSVATDENGHYLFEGLADGSYTVRVDATTVPTGSTQTADPDAAKDHQGTASVSAGGSVLTMDFGYKPAGITHTVSGTLFNDNGDGGGTAGNGIKDGTEPGLISAGAGVTVRLYGSTGTEVLATAVTDANGNYAFAGIPDGNYIVKADPNTLPPGYVPTADPDGTADNKTAVTVSGADIPAKNFAYQQMLGSISGTVVRGNGNGIADAGEPPLANVTVTLKYAGPDGILGTADDVITTTTTDASGNYTFAGLYAGKYQVLETNPAGITSVADADGGNPDNISVTLAAGEDKTDRDFEDQPGTTVTIQGTVFNDLNGDSTQDAGEDGISGVTVTLTDSAGATKTATTDADGNYLFDNLAPGTYTIKETDPTGFGSTTDNEVSVTGAAGEVKTVNFGDREAGGITGTVFDDINGNGTQDPGETGIPGVTVTLLDVNGSTLKTATTDADGNYSFTGVTPGTYTVKETDPSGYISTSDNTVPVVVPTGGSGTANFGDHQTAGITGVVFNDISGDMLQGAGEPGIPGVTVALLDSAGSTVRTAVTDANGAYSFTGLAPGTYTVKETDPATYTSTTGNSVPVILPAGGAGIANFGDHQVGTVTGVVFDDINGDKIQGPGEEGIPGVTVTLTDSAGVAKTAVTDANGAYLFDSVAPGTYTVKETDPTGSDFSWGSTTANQFTVTVPAGGYGIADFGDHKVGTVTGVVYNDINGDMIQEPGEPGIPGVTVTLTDSAGTVRTTVTDSSGAYIFNSVTAGTYTAAETDPAGFVSTTGNSSSVTVPAGGAGIANFGDQEANSISGTVFNDLNADGVFDPDETGMFNIKVELLNSSGAVIATAFTDVSGNYSFNNVAPGNYTVRETDPEGFGSSTDNAVQVTLTSGGSATADFGDVEKGTISGTVFNDIDANTTQETGELGIAGVTVTLLDSAGNVVATAQTDANGDYIFRNLQPGTYTVKETDLPDYSSTTDNQLTVTLPAAGSATADFGDRKKNSISGIVFKDVNGNGVHDPGEDGIPGVTVTLLDDAGNVVQTTVTDANGDYLFDGSLPPGDYTVKESDPTGSDFSWGSTTNNEVSVSLSPGDTGTANFGDHETGSITGTVFNDIDGNTKQDTGEKGIPGVTVKLLDADGNVLKTAATDASGNYSFTGLVPGDYTVTETDLTGWTSTGDNTVPVTLPAGGAGVANFGDQEKGSLSGIVYNDVNNNGNHDPAEDGIGNVTVTLKDSSGNVIGTVLTHSSGDYVFHNLTPGTYTVTETDSDGYASTTDNTVTVILPAGGAGTANFGDREIAGITGTVFNDVNGNKIQESGEPGLLNVTVELLDASGNVIATAKTDGSGNYAFRNLTPGDYTVRELDPAGYASTTANTVAVPLPAGTVGTANFGDQRTSSVSGTVFTDINGDKTQNPDEYGIAGVVVYADVNNNGVHDPNEPSAPADRFGDYTIMGLAPGTYTLLADKATVHQGFSVSTDPLKVTLTASAPVTDADIGYKPLPVNISTLSKNVTDINGGNLLAGDILLYEVMIRNMSAKDVTGVVFEDPIPANTVYVPGSLSAPAGSTAEPVSNLIRITGITLPASGQTVISFRVQLSDPLAADVTEIRNQATLTYDSNGDGTNDTTAKTDGNTSQPGIQPTVIPVAAGPNFSETEKIAVLKNDADYNVVVSSGDTLEYQIAIRNTGDTDAANVFFRDPVPVNTTYVPGTVSVLSPADSGTVLYNASRNRIEWTGDVAAGAEITLVFDVTINPNVPQMTVISNQGFVEYDSNADGTNDATEPTDSNPDAPGNQPAESVVSGMQCVAIKNVEDINGGNLEPGDVLLYTIILTNKSEREGRNTELVDTIPAYTTYVPGSLAPPSGSTVISETPTIRIQGITVPAKGQVAISFRVKVVNPIPDGVIEISNQALMNYHHLNPAIPDRIWETDGDLTRSGQNPTVIPVTAGPNFTTTSKSFSIQHDEGSDGVVSPGDTLRYKVLISNTGSQNASGVVFTDPIPQYTTYLGASVNADAGTATYNASEPGASATGQIRWTGDVAAGQTVTLFFDVTVNTGIPAGTVISNQGTVSFDSDGDGINESKEPTDGDTATPGNQPTDAKVGGLEIVASKSVKDTNGGNVEPGDELTYTVKLQNPTGFAVSGAEFADTVPSHTTLIPGSISKPTGTTLVSETPIIRITGISLPANGQTTLSFRVKINKPLAEGVTEISNTGTVSYDTNGDGTNDGRKYTDGDTSKPGEQPTVLPITAGPNFSETTKDFGLQVDADNNAVGNAGDTLRYTVVIRNTGNADAKAVEFKDKIPANTSYVSGSVVYSKPGESGNASFNTAENRIEWTGDVAAGASVTLTFDVKIADGVPTETLISNQGFVYYDTDGDGTNDGTEPTDGDTSAPGNQPTDVMTSGMVCVAIKTVEDVNGGNVEPGDELLYTVILTNKSERQGSGAEIVDSIPANTSYVPGSIAPPPGSTVVSETPTIHVTGVTVPAKGQTTLSFRVKVDDPLPAGVTEIANQATMTYYHETPGVNYRVWETDGDLTTSGQNPTVIPVTAGPNFTTTNKSVSLRNDADGDGGVSPGDTLRYTVLIANTGTQNASGAVFTDPIPVNTAYLGASVKADAGTASYNVSLNRIEWRGDVAAGKTVTLLFDVTVNSGLAFGTVISNQGTVNFDSDGDGINESEEPTDGDTSTPGNQPADVKVGAPPAGIAVKTATDVNGGDLEGGDEIVYTISLKNQSGTDAVGMEFSDVIPSHTVYVPESLTVPENSLVVTESPIIRVKNISVPAHQERVISFRVQVENPNPDGVTEIRNQGTISYDSNGDGVIDARQWTDGNPSQPGEQPTVTPLTPPVSEIGAIRGIVFNDLDADGVQDYNEGSIGGATLELLDSSGKVIDITVSGTDGRYSFTDLSPGSYTVRETDIFGFVSSTDNEVPVTVPAGGVGIADFGDYYETVAAPGSIVGKVFEDLNLNGVQDAGEPGIPGATVKLTSPDGTVLTATTAADGTYRFSNLPASVYTVSETDPTGYTSTTDNSLSVTLPEGGSGRADFGDVSESVDILGNITGTVFNDVNGNGVRDSGEGVIGGATLELLDSSGNVLDITVSGTDGRYSFTDLPAGTYTVRETDVFGFVSSTSNEVAVTLPTGGTGVADFGDRQEVILPGSITGIVFNDVNGDGVQGAGEPGIPGVTVETHGRASLQTVTDADGAYVFENVPPGDYTVSETDPSGFTSTTPNSVPVTVPEGGAAVANFGDSIYSKPGGSVTGLVFNDLNGDGVQNPGELGIPGVTVELKDSNGNVVDTTTTDENGSYVFADVPPGDYTVEEVASPGFTPTGPVTQPVTVGPDGGETANFGNIRIGTVSGIVFNDLNGDGVQNPGELGIPGVTVELLDSNGNVIATTTTDADGTYSLADVSPGSYTVRETDPGGFTSTTANTKPVTVPENGAGVANFGDKQIGDVTGVVFNDLNGDGVQNPGEEGIPGVTVELKDGTGNVIGTTTTDENGNYVFADVPPGDYTVEEVASPGFTPTGPVTQPVTVGPDGGETANFGNIRIGTVSGIVFNDLNGDGVQNPGELGISGVTVELFDADGNLADITTTDSGGNYSFDDVTPGSYTIRETDLSGFVSSTPNAVMLNVSETAAGTANFGDRQESVLISGSITGVVFNDADGNKAQGAGEAGIPGVTVELLDSSGSVIATTATNANGAYRFNNVAPGTYTVRENDPAGFSSTTDNSAGVTVPEGGVGTADFGDRKEPGSVTGIVFNDANGDGVQNPGESGISGVRIELLNSSGNVIVAVFTNAGGVFQVGNLTPGTYTVRESDPAGFTSTTANTVSGVTVPPGGVGTANFGDRQEVILSGSITGLVFNDADGNGVQGAGEAGIPGVAVELLNAQGNVIATAFTNANGAYSFSDLVPGTYTVRESDPSGFTSTTANTVSGVIVPPAGIGTANFGDRQGTGSITGVVFNDINGDRLQGAGEQGIPGVEISLTDSGGNVVATTTTNDDGTYAFDNIPEGAYTVEQTQPPSSTPTGDTVLPVSVVPGETASANFGNMQSGTVSGIVFNDVNGNGVQEPGEAGVAGVEIDLIDSDGNIVATATTAGNGTYIFTDVPAGNYTVEQVTPPGLVPMSSDTVPVTLGDSEPGGSAAAANFGNIQAGTVSGVVFNDLNGNGVQDPGEAGIGNVSVSLTDDKGNVIATVATSGSGAYTFTDVPPCDSSRNSNSCIYAVAETEPNGFTSTTTNTVWISVPQNGAATANFGDIQVGTVSGSVFIDSNGNGVQDLGEPGIGGVSVSLTDPNGNVIATVTTTGNGDYIFTGIDPGAYLAVVQTPPGFAPATSETVPISVGPGGAATANFGAVQTGTLNGIVFIDSNGDHVQNPGEPGIGGVTVELTDLDGTLIATVTSKGDGSYLFSGLEPGIYTVRETDPPNFVSVSDNTVTVSVSPSATVNFGDIPAGTLSGTVFNDINGNGYQDPGEKGLGGVVIALTTPGGDVLFTATTAGDGSYIFTGIPEGDYILRETEPSGFVPVTGTSVPVHVGTGGTQTVVFGNQQGGSVSGVVFYDFNGNGIHDPGEKGIGGVTVELKDKDGNIIGTIVTAGDGFYVFTGLNEATYTVVKTDPEGFNPTNSSVITVTVGADRAGTANFGNRLVGTISGIVFDDINNNKVQDRWERGISGVTVELLNADGAVIATALTAGDGSYIFTEVTGGIYTVRESDLPEFVSTTENRVAVSVPNKGSGSANFGDRLVRSTVPGTVSGYVFNDRNGNGIRDAGEEGIPGVTVELRDNEGKVVATAITSCDGKYLFTDVPEGSYTVWEKDPQGYVSVTPNTVSVTVKAGGAATADFGDRQGCTMPIRLDAEKTAVDLNDGNPEPGDVIEYQIDITNTGLGTATGLVFTDSVPRYTRMVAGSLTTTQGTITRESPIVIKIGDLEPGDTVSIDFRVTIIEGIQDGIMIMNQGAITGDNGIALFTDDPMTPDFYDPTMLVVGKSLYGYEPPIAYKTVSGNLPVLKWETVWINKYNTDGIMVHIEDPVPDNVSFVEGSLKADYGNVSYDSANRKIIWEGVIPGNGGELRIGYETSVPNDADHVENQACAVWDRNGNGDWRDEAVLSSERILVCTDDPNSDVSGDATGWVAPEPQEWELPMKPF